MVNFERPMVRLAFYTLSFFVFFLISLGLTFPDDRIRDILITQAEAQMEGNYAITVEDLDLWWLMGIQLEEVQLKERVVAPGAAPAAAAAGGGGAKAGGAEGEEAAAPAAVAAGGATIRLDEVGARLAPLTSLFNVSPAVKFEVELGEGSIEGVFIRGDKEHRLELEIDSVDLRKTDLLSSWMGLPTFGVLNGEATVTIDARTGQPVDGKLALDGKQVTFGPGEIYLDAGKFSYIDVPLSNLGTMKLRAEIKKGKGARSLPTVEFEEFSFKGRDIRGELWGNLALSQGRTTPDLKMRLQMDKGFVKREGLSRILQEPRIMRGKGTSGWFGIKVFRRGRRVAFDGDPLLAKGREASEALRGGDKGEGEGEEKK